MSALEIKLYTALHRIANDYMTSEQLHRRSPKMYGLDGSEAIEMAYDNILLEAKAAIKGVRKPKS